MSIAIGVDCFRNQISDHDVLFSLSNVAASYERTDSLEESGNPWLKVEQVEPAADDTRDMAEFVKLRLMMGSQDSGAYLENRDVMHFLKAAIAHVLVDKEDRDVFIRQDSVEVQRGRIKVGGFRKTETKNFYGITKLALQTR